ncbi:SDR family NAD(P)-dependent oxidoreductase [Streptomyces acidicola]|uniref:SDR family NAD(P)-dependent oxidoreductase n=1 Tax=Streptomyces acidicola TaxID=2596892 RepID=UPI0037FC54B4
MGTELKPSTDLDLDLGLAGKRALVTGGTRGLGRAVVRALAAHGANVVTCYRSAGEAARRLADELAATGGDHHVVQADVTTPEGARRVADECRARFGGLDVVVNNVGTMSRQPLAETTLDAWRHTMSVNLGATFLVTRLTVPLLSTGASVINLGTAAAARGLPGHSPYTASKAGLAGLTRSLAKELGAAGVRVNLVNPGILGGEVPVPPPQADHLRSLTALGRLGTAEEVAGVVAFLAGDLASYVTGATITADGGI